MANPERPKYTLFEMIVEVETYLEAERKARQKGFAFVSAAFVCAMGALIVFALPAAANAEFGWTVIGLAYLAYWWGYYWGYKIWPWWHRGD